MFPHFHWVDGIGGTMGKIILTIILTCMAVTFITGFFPQMIAVWEVLKNFPWRAIGIVIIVVVIWFSGERYGSNRMEKRLQIEHLSQFALENKQLADALAREVQYEARLKSAALQAVSRSNRIVSAARAPVPALVRHASNDYAPVSEPPTPPGEEAGPGGPDTVRGPDINIGPALRGLHVLYANALNECYSALDQAE